MATDFRTDKAMSLEEFLGWSRIDEQPYLEYIDGRIEVKVSPQFKHSIIQLNLPPALNDVARPRRLGLAVPELRCTFGGRSILPDIVFLLDANIRCDEQGEVLNEVFIRPDIHVEIRSPAQASAKNIEKIEHSLRHGCQLGWYFDPENRRASIHRPGQAVEHLKADGFIDGEPVLPGFRLAISVIFGWLVYRQPGLEQSGADPS